MFYNQYIRTDLAAECPAIEKSTALDGVSVKNEKDGFCSVTTIDVTTPEGADILGKSMGRYVTVQFGNIVNYNDNELSEISKVLTNQLISLSKSVSGNDSPEKVLVIGLGNQYITPDAIGPLTIKGITVTRHLQTENQELFDMLKMQSISAFSPGVVGQTGIETYDLIKSAVNKVQPDMLVVIDALASKSTDRLASTVQICDTGISPGSGIGNKRSAINSSTMDVPVIAIGTPTMVSSSTLVYDALEKAGITDLSENLVEVLENGKSFFVTLNDSDLVVSTLSDIISNAINLWLFKNNS